MIRTLVVLVLTGLFALAISCSRGGDTGLGAVTIQSDTREADIQAVKDLEAAWAKDAAAKDADKFASYYADDASALMPGEPLISGKPAIAAALKSMFGDPNFSLNFQATRADASKGGDFVYTQGSYTMAMSDPKTRKPVTDKGKYLTIFKKQADGSWKAVADMINSDGAAPSGH